MRTATGPGSTPDTSELGSPLTGLWQPHGQSDDLNAASEQAHGLRSAVVVQVHSKLAGSLT